MVSVYKYFFCSHSLNLVLKFRRSMSIRHCIDLEDHESFIQICLCGMKCLNPSEARDKYVFYHKNFVESKQQESMSLCKLSEILGIFQVFLDLYATAMTETGSFRPACDTCHFCLGLIFSFEFLSNIQSIHDCKKRTRFCQMII